VCAVYDPTVISRVGVCLSTQLEAEVFDNVWQFYISTRCAKMFATESWAHTGRRTTQGLCNAAKVDNDSFDAVAFAFDL
jgi:hypothetical protein